MALLLRLPWKGRLAVDKATSTEKGSPPVFCPLLEVVTPEGIHLKVPVEGEDHAQDRWKEAMRLHVFHTCLFSLLSPAKGQLRNWQS